MRLNLDAAFGALHPRANLAAAALITGTSEDPAYSASNLQSPQRPLSEPAKTLALGAQSFTIDIGATSGTFSYDVLHVVASNVPQHRWLADDAPTFDSAAGSPQYDSGLLTAARCPYNGRYQHAHRPASQQFRRYVRYVIPSQTPANGDLVYVVGGVWIGLFPVAPVGVRWAPKMVMGEPHVDVPLLGGGRQRVTTGEPLARGTLTLRVDTGLTPALSDDLRAWYEIRRQWRLVGIALLSLHDDDPSQTWVMQPVDDGAEASPTYGLTDLSLDVEEVVAP